MREAVFVLEWLHGKGGSATVLTAGPRRIDGNELVLPARYLAAEGFVGIRRGIIPGRLLQPGQGRVHLLLQGLLDEPSLEPPLKESGSHDLSSLEVQVWFYPEVLFQLSK